MRRLLLDIETAPHLAMVWGMFNENIPLDRLLDSGYTLCWAAKWYGEDGVLYDSLYRNSAEDMIGNLHELLDEADIVIHYNGRKFDIPTINKEFLAAGLTPPSPYKQVDLLSTARKQFRFASNKLDYVANFLGLGEKVKHRGFDLWKDCMNNKRTAWQEMTDYNIQDVILLEKLYDKLLPWIPNHPNIGIFTPDKMVCPVCGGDHLVKRGPARTKVGIYQRYRCSDCGTWARARIMDKVDRTNLIIKEV